MSTAIVLFTRDLRLHDNPALRSSLDVADEVVPLFVLDTAILAGAFCSANKAAFLSQCLHDLDARLGERGARLVIRTGDVAEQVAQVAKDTNAKTVHVARDVSGYSGRREAALRGRLGDRTALHVHGGSLTVVDPGTLTPSGARDHFAVFTPYYKRWVRTDKRKPLMAPRRISVPHIDSDDVPMGDDLLPGEPSPNLPRGGETPGRERLRRWLAGPAHRYADRHDDLGVDGTSRLSPYLHFGCISPTEVLHRLHRRTHAGEAAVRQLAWRDFHHQVLAAHPDAATRNYRDRGDDWDHDEAVLEAWRRGCTGYPIVDAGMRQLLADGWMHNRARLITSSFFCKSLYLDWRVGAQHFIEWLVDADIANNQLNWQWMAGTGTDTRPNRMLNPVRQAERYDPAGTYTRQWVPELAGLDPPSLHRPWTLPSQQRADLCYPDPIVAPDVLGRRFRAARLN